MQARGQLMVEHRLIERMIGLLKAAAGHIALENRIEPAFLDAALDFIRTYVDRTHHGKEENLLFRELDRKPLSIADRQVMNDLIAEHVFGRNIAETLAASNTRYRDGDASALAEIADKLKTMADFYPRHIEKEDKVFFPAARAYFTDEEDQALLAEFREFDRYMIHEKYKSLVKELGG